MSVCLSVCLSPSVRMEQLVSHWTDFHEIWYLSIFRKSIQVPLKSDNNIRYCSWKHMYAYDNVMLNSHCSNKQQCAEDILRTEVSSWWRDKFSAVHSSIYASLAARSIAVNVDCSHITLLPCNTFHCSECRLLSHHSIILQQVPLQLMWTAVTSLYYLAARCTFHCS
jgi:hypothetical protein